MVRMSVAVAAWLTSALALLLVSYALIDRLNARHGAAHNHISIDTYAAAPLQTVDLLVGQNNSGTTVTLKFHEPRLRTVWVLVSGVDKAIGCFKGSAMTANIYNEPEYGSRLTTVKGFPNAKLIVDTVSHPAFAATDLSLIRLVVGNRDTLKCALTRKPAETSFVNRDIAVDINATQFRWLEEMNWWHADPVDRPYTANYRVNFHDIAGFASLRVSGGTIENNRDGDDTVRLLTSDSVWFGQDWMAEASWVDEGASRSRDIWLVALGTILGLAGAALMEAGKSLFTRSATDLHS